MQIGVISTQEGCFHLQVLNIHTECHIKKSDVTEIKDILYNLNMAIICAFSDTFSENAFILLPWFVDMKSVIIV